MHFMKDFCWLSFYVCFPDLSVQFIAYSVKIHPICWYINILPDISVIKSDGRLPFRMLEFLQI